MDGFDWTPIVNWRLKSGSHKFPGPDGGTCVNEAAIVAAGFPYKKIDGSKDCPQCFSRPFAGYAIWLNDWIADADRNELLMPFVLRLAGTAYTDQIEEERRAYLTLGTMTRVVPFLLEETWPRHAKALRKAADWESVRSYSFLHLFLGGPPDTVTVRDTSCRRVVSLSRTPHTRRTTGSRPCAR